MTWDQAVNSIELLLTMKIMLFGYLQLGAAEKGGFSLEEVGIGTTTSGFAMVTLATGVVT